MSEVKWTAEQRAAIEARGHTLLVSAAAGSGKTAVLVQRILERVLDEKNPCDCLLYTSHCCLKGACAGALRL